MPEQPVLSVWNSTVETCRKWLLYGCLTGLGEQERTIEAQTWSADEGDLQTLFVFSFRTQPGGAQTSFFLADIATPKQIRQEKNNFKIKAAGTFMSVKAQHEAVYMSIGEWRRFWCRSWTEGHLKWELLRTQILFNKESQSMKPEKFQINLNLFWKYMNSFSLLLSFQLRFLTVMSSLSLIFTLRTVSIWFSSILQYIHKSVLHLSFLVIYKTWDKKQLHKDMYWAIVGFSFCVFGALIDCGCTILVLFTKLCYWNVFGAIPTNRVIRDHNVFLKPKLLKSDFLCVFPSFFDPSCHDFPIFNNFLALIFFPVWPSFNVGCTGL